MGVQTNQSRLADAAMQCSGSDLQAMRALAGHTVSHAYGAPLAVWLEAYVRAELERREFKTASYPSDLFENRWSPEQLTGCLCISHMWQSSAVSPMMQQFFDVVHKCIIGHCCRELLSYQDQMAGV